MDRMRQRECVCVCVCESRKKKKKKKKNGIEEKGKKERECFAALALWRLKDACKGRTTKKST